MFATIQIMIVLLFRLLSQYVETDTYRKVSLPVFWKDVKPVLSYWWNNWLDSENTVQTKILVLRYRK